MAASRWLKPAMWQELRRWKQDWAEFVIRAVDCSGEKGEARMVDALKEYARVGRREGHEILQTLDEILLANPDVTTHVLSWMLILRAENRRVQTRLRRKIRANSD